MSISIKVDVLKLNHYLSTGLDSFEFIDVNDVNRIKPWKVALDPFRPHRQ